MNDSRPRRKQLPHAVPTWVPDGATFFVTLNARPRGDAPLLIENRPAQLWASLQAYAEKRFWWPHLFLVMPDHLHMLTTFAPVPGMSAAIAQWKRWTARTLQIQWQRDFFDHRIRNAQEYEEKAFYVRHNPVRKQLATNPQDWPYVWECPASLR